MTESTAGALAQVTALDEERRRYEGWIAQLDARRGTTPEHVLQRVRGDYEARLREVVGRLGEHAELLRSTVADRAQELATLRDAERQLEDQRAEAELRAAVGEFTPERWQEIAGRSDAELAELAGRRSAAEAELERLEQVLELALQGTRAAGRRDGSGQPTAQPATSFRDEAPAAEPTPRGLTDAGGLGPEGVPEPDPWAVTAPVRSARAAEPAAGATGGGRDAERRTPAESLPAAPAAPAAAQARAADGEGGQAKTLRCQECGTMNYPTEWYCERCGGELAAL